MRPRRLGPAVIGTAIALIAAIILLAQQPEPRSVAATSSDDATGITGVLDGLIFAGQLKSVDGTNTLDDTLHFSEGHFWSSGCIKCSFMPGDYWTRRNGEAVEFHGVLESPERGRFTYRGTVVAGRLEAKIHWLRERWYWTVDRDYVFEGSVDDAAQSSVTLRAARSRALGEAAPTCTI